MNRILLFVLIFIPFFCLSQKSLNNYKIISFVRNDSIFNSNQNKISNKKLDKVLGNIFKDFADSLNIVIPDSIGKSEIEYSNSDLKKFDKVFHYKILNDSIIERYSTNRDLQILEYPIYINQKSLKETYNFPYKQNEMLFNYQFEKIKNLKILKTNENKKINGIKCNKIIVNFTKLAEDYFPEINVYQELWVTKKIKSLVHPTYKIKEILEEYYPLEILQKDNFNVGTISNYKIFEMN